MTICVSFICPRLIFFQVKAATNFLFIPLITQDDLFQSDLYCIIAAVVSFAIIFHVLLHSFILKIMIFCCIVFFV